MVHLPFSNRAPSVISKHIDMVILCRFRGFMVSQVDYRFLGGGHATLVVEECMGVSPVQNLLGACLPSQNLRMVLGLLLRSTTVWHRSGPPGTLTAFGRVKKRKNGYAVQRIVYTPQPRRPDAMTHRACLEPRRSERLGDASITGLV